MKGVDLAVGTVLAGPLSVPSLESASSTEDTADVERRWEDSVLLAMWKSWCRKTDEEGCRQKGSKKEKEECLLECESGDVDSAERANKYCADDQE
jgi:hypothetical protein